MKTRLSHLKRFKAASLFRAHIQFGHILIAHVQMFNYKTILEKKPYLLYELLHKPDTGNPWECLKLSNEAFKMG